MSSSELPLQTFDLEWDNYPRVRFLRDRYQSLYPRFKNLTKALPHCFRNSDLMSDIQFLYSDLDHPLHVMIYSRVVFTKNDIFLSTSLSDSKRIPLEGLRFPNDESVVALYVTDLAELSDAELRRIRTEGNLESDIMMIHEGTKNWPHTAIFRTKKLLNEANMSRISNVLSVSKGMYPNKTIKVLNICKPANQVIAMTISRILEERIVNRFLKISSHLKSFIRLDRSYDHPKVSVLHSEEIVQAIIGAILKTTKYKSTEHDEHLGDSGKPKINTDSPSAASSQQKEDHNIDTDSPEGNKNPKLESHEKATDPTTLFAKLHIDVSSKLSYNASVCLAVKYNLTESTCLKLLEELKFADRIKESMENHDAFYFQNLFYLTTEDDTYTVQKDLVHLIQSNVEDIFDETERVMLNMEKVVTIMRKMGFEIKGYVSQSCITQLLEDDCFANRPLPQDVRKQILGINGVFSVATVYGEPEIGVYVADKEDLLFETVKAKVKDVLKENSYNHPYRIELLETLPKPFGGPTGVRYEQGDEILCQSPEKINEMITGTLGMCLLGSDNNAYGLTCAHVVEHAAKQIKSKINLRKSSATEHIEFGNVSESLIVRRFEGHLRSLDIAAVRVCSEGRHRCNYELMDDKAIRKQVLFSCVDGVDLIGKHVYKYGAKTTFTEGVVKSNDCYFSNMDSELILIEALPSCSEDWSVMGATAWGADGKFADEGDSGAVVCMTEINDGSVMAVSMISGGDNTSQNPFAISIPMDIQMTGIIKRIAESSSGFHFKLPQ